MKPELEQWVIPITIAMRSDDEDLGISLMSSLASTSPGIASKVLKELDDNKFITVTEIPPIDKTSQELGLAIRKSMADWGFGLGSELMREIGPVNESGALYPLGMSVDSCWVTTSWYRGTKNLEPVVEAPDFDRYGSDRNIDPGWRSLLRTTVNTTKYWPWVLTKDMLEDSLKEEIESMRLSLMSVDAVRELSYEFGSNLFRSAFTNLKVNAIEDVLAFVESKLSNVEYVSIHGSKYTDREIQAIVSGLSRMLNHGEIFIKDPWPGPDKTLPAGRTSWRRFEDYTDSRLLERVVAIYEAALRIYTDMTATYFNNLGTGSRRRLILQAKLEGMLTIPSSYDSYRDSPVLTYWPRSAEENEQSRIDFHLAYEDYDSHERIEQMEVVARPENLEGLGSTFVHSTMQPLGHNSKRPATELAYKWLNADLEEIDWAR